MIVFAFILSLTAYLLLCLALLESLEPPIEASAARLCWVVGRKAVPAFVLAMGANFLFVFAPFVFEPSPGVSPLAIVMVGLLERVAGGVFCEVTWILALMLLSLLALDWWRERRRAE